MIYCSHLYILTFSDNPLIVALYKKVFYEGYLGVTFFFILSGFVLTYGYNEQFISHSIKKRKFYISRFIRIYPLHILTLLIALPLWNSFFVEHPWKALNFLICNLFLVQSFIPAQQCYYFLNEPSWALSNEIFFYICCPFIIPRIAQISIRGMFGIILLLALCITFLVVYNKYIPPSDKLWLFYINPFLRIYDFILGIVLAFFFIKTKNIFTIIDNRFFTFLEIFSVILLIVFVAGNPHIADIARYDLYYTIPISFIILVFAFERGFFSKALSCPGLVMLGRLSFAFYMLHLSVIHYMGKLFCGIYTIALGSFFITLALSIPAHFFIEQPLNQALRKKLL